MIAPIISAVGALAARWYLSKSMGGLLGSRIELANGFTSMRSTEEGLALMQLGISPYEGELLTSSCALSLAARHTEICRQTLQQSNSQSPGQWKSVIALRITSITRCRIGLPHAAVAPGNAKGYGQHTCPAERAALAERRCVRDDTVHSCTLA
jgi:hypothetical protein